MMCKLIDIVKCESQMEQMCEIWVSDGFIYPVMVTDHHSREAELLKQAKQKFCSLRQPESKEEKRESVHVPLHNVSKREQRGWDLQAVEFRLLRNNPQKWRRNIQPCMWQKEFSMRWRVSQNIPGLGRSPGEGKGYPLQYSGLENVMNCIVHGVTKSWIRLSDFHFHMLTIVLRDFKLTLTC